MAIAAVTAPAQVPRGRCRSAVRRLVAPPALATASSRRQLTVFCSSSRRMPRALRYRSEITEHVSDIAIGAGALVIGGGMFFVIASISFFTGTEVGLEGFTGLQQIGAQAFTGVVSSLANTREITPLVAGVALAAQVGAGFTAQSAPCGSPRRSTRSR